MMEDYRVPEDLSVVGFDDILIAENTQPALTMVARPRTERINAAFQALWALGERQRRRGARIRPQSESCDTPGGGRAR
jgi:DNA-binding LacI/PurR family transcriptional regulator